MTKSELKNITIEYDASGSFGDSITVNGITIMECLGYEEFLDLKVRDIIGAYEEIIKIEGAYNVK